MKQSSANQKSLIQVNSKLGQVELGAEEQEDQR